jgi:hypothetical protein
LYSGDEKPRYNARMKDNYTLHLSHLQARGLNAALTLINQLMNVPPNTPVYPHLPTEGVERPLVKDELKLLHEDIVRQFKEQDQA